MRVRYAVVIEKVQNNYAAYVPDLDGCVPPVRLSRKLSA